MTDPQHRCEYIGPPTCDELTETGHAVLPAPQRSARADIGDDRDSLPALRRNRTTGPARSQAAPTRRVGRIVSDAGTTGSSRRWFDPRRPRTWIVATPLVRYYLDEHVSADAWLETANTSLANMDSARAGLRRAIESIKDSGLRATFL